MTLRSIRKIFKMIESNPSTLYTVNVSYVEIYNNEIRDLLTPPSDALPHMIEKVKIVVLKCFPYLPSLLLLTLLLPY
jgi:hypothetical protein